MGWTTYYRAPGETDRDHLQRELRGTQRIVDCTTIGTTFYAAVRGNDTGDVQGLVVLQRRTRGHDNYARKAITETMGPVHDRCPDRILDLLSPTDNEWANEWRARCRARNAAKRNQPRVHRGDTVRFARPITFANGAVLDALTFDRRSTFTHTGTRYHIRRWRDLAYTVAA